MVSSKSVQMTDIEPAAISAEFSPPEETQNHVKTYGEPISFETVVKNLALLTRESQGFAYRYLSLAKQGLTNVSTLSQFPYIYSLVSFNRRTLMIRRTCRETSYETFRRLLASFRCCTWMFPIMLLNKCRKGLRT